MMTNFLYHCRRHCLKEYVLLVIIYYCDIFVVDQTVILVSKNARP